MIASVQLKQTRVYTRGRSDTLLLCVACCWCGVGIHLRLCARLSRGSILLVRVYGKDSH